MSRIWRSSFGWLANYSLILTLPLLVAGAAGIYAALVPCAKPARRLLYFVLVPSAIDIFAIIALAFFQVSRSPIPATTVFEQHGAAVSWRAFLETLTSLGPGLQFAGAGMVLVAIFFVLLVRGRASVPIRVRASAEFSRPQSDGMPESAYERTMIFVWAMICLVPLTLLADTFVINRVAMFSLLAHVDSRVAELGLPLIGILVDTLCLLALVLLAMGGDGRSTVLRTLRLTEVKYPILAVFFPAALASVWPLLNYAHDRILWASYEWGQVEPPLLASYFGRLTAASLSFFAFALPEEIAWRGYLQPRFIRRYGVARGIFLVGVVWGAFHFWTDSYGYSPTYVILNWVTRVATMVAVGYVLAWLTIKSRSILPAVIAHAVYNVTAIGNVVTVENPWWLRLLLWAALGYAVFRFDPPEAELAETATALPPETAREGETGRVETA